MKEPELDGKTLSEICGELVSTDPKVRWDAALSLSFLGESAQPAIPRLLELVDDPNSRVRANVARAMLSIGVGSKEVVGALCAMLNDPDWYVRRCAVEAISRLSPRPLEPISAVAGLLQDVNEEVRYAALSTLGAYGPLAKELLPQVIATLNDADHSVRKQAATTLGQIRSADDSVIQALAKALQDEDCWVTQEASFALAELQCRDAVPPLVRSLLEPKHGEFTLDITARALERLGTLAKPALPSLVALFDHQDDSVILHAIRAVGEIKAPHQDVLGALERVAKSDHDAFRLAAVTALAQIDPMRTDNAVKILIAGAGLKKATDARVEAYRGLGRFGSQSREALEFLISVMKRGKSRYLDEVANALGYVGPAALEAIPVMEDAVRRFQGNESLWESATRAIERIDPSHSKKK